MELTDPTGDFIDFSYNGVRIRIKKADLVIEVNTLIDGPGGPSANKTTVLLTCPPGDVSVFMPTKGDQ